MLFEEVLTVFRENRREEVNTLCRPNAEFLNISSCSIFIYIGLQMRNKIL
jgi:hypothetical protein